MQGSGTTRKLGAHQRKLFTREFKNLEKNLKMYNIIPLMSGFAGACVTRDSQVTATTALI